MPLSSSLVPWPGSKRLLARHILPLIPEHTCFVEVFGGAAQLILSKEPSRVETYNDLDGGLVNAFRVTKHHPEALCAELETYLNAEAEFSDFLAQPGITDLQRAARFILRYRLSFGGQGRHFGTTRAQNGGGSVYSRKALQQIVVTVAERFDRVQVTNDDWQRCLARFDAPGTVFFCDPPYTQKGAHYGSWSEAEFAELRQALDQLKGSWITTICDSSAARRAFSGHHIREVSRANGIGNLPGSVRKDQGKLVELIITPATPPAPK